MYPPASGAKCARLRRRRIAVLLVSLLLLAVPARFIKVIPSAHAAGSPGVRISQAYGGGGSSSGSPAYTHDYVELFNAGAAAANVGGHSLQYGSSTGQFGSSASNIYTLPAGTTIPAGGYLLVKLGAAGAAGAAFTADLTSGGLSMAAGSGKVALVTTGAALGCGATATPCALPDARIVDLVAWGASNNAEGGAAVGGAALTSAQGAARKSNGCVDTDNNGADFNVLTTAGGLVPRTAASPLNPCGGGGETNAPPAINAPADPAANVAQDSAAFNVALVGSDDNNVFNWSATPGAGVASVVVGAGQSTAGVTYTVTLAPGFAGAASFTASLSDGVNAPATRVVNVNVTPLVPNAPPSIEAPANPAATVAQDAAPFAVGLNGSDDDNAYAWSATPGAGVSAVAVSAGQGTAAVTYTVTLQPGFSGATSFTARLSDGVNPQVSRAVNITVTPAPPPPLDHVVISQLYGGGGNSGAAFQHDFVELFNPDAVAHDLSGWTIQYGSATGSTWQAQPLGGVMQPGEYYLIKLGSNDPVGAALPAANINGSLNLSGTSGKVALVRAGDPLEGCAPADPTLVDLVGYGPTANCREGAANAPSPGGNANALFRKLGGFADTNVNGADFAAAAASPRRTTPIVELPPTVLSSDPRSNGFNAPRDASVTVNFTEPVTVEEGWFKIACAETGAHDGATVAPGGANSWIIIPNVNFKPGEQCALSVFKGFVRDADQDDAGPDTDLLTRDYASTFTVASGAAPAYGPEVHLALGNPSGAEADLDKFDNYLMSKPEFALSYNRDRGAPNWVSWHLSDEWVGDLARVDSFRADPAVPADWYRVTHVDYTNTGFDRGHLTPNADRDAAGAVPTNQATFLMTNMLPQAPDNNQGPWAHLENSLRTQVTAGNEVYIVAGGAGAGGTGSGGYAETIAGGRVHVPAQTWKVALLLPKDAGDDAARVTCATRTIAVVMPNVQGIRDNDWRDYLTTVDEVERLTGYDFFANLPDHFERCVEAGANGVNPPGAADSGYTTAEDTAAAVTLTGYAGSGAAPLTYEVVGGPAHGTLAGTGASRVYTPAPDFNGTDSFTFRVNDGAGASSVSTVTILVTEVNDAPTLSNVPESATVLLGSTLAFTAAGADPDSPAQTLAYSLTGAAPEGAVIDPSSGAFSWTPTAAQAGRVHTFGVRVTDGGGLHAERFVSVAAAYTWTGLLQPVNQDGGSVFKLGQTVPVKFALTGAGAGVTDAAARLYVTKVSDQPTGADEKEAVSTSGATSGNLFRYADGQYVFNLSTKGLTAGTYQLRVDTGDGVARVVNISLR